MALVGIAFTLSGNCAPTRAGPGVAVDVIHHRRIRQGRRVLERFGVALVAIGMLVEDAVAASYRGLAVAIHIIGKTNAGRGIEQLSLHATDRNAGGYTALHNAVRQSVDEQVVHAAIGIDGGHSGLVVRRIEIECLLLLFAVGPEQAHPHAEIQGQATGDVPVILEIGFNDLVAVVVLDPLVLLPVAGDFAQQQVGEWIARGNTCAGIEGQVTGDGTCSSSPPSSFFWPNTA